MIQTKLIPPLKGVKGDVAIRVNLIFAILICISITGVLAQSTLSTKSGKAIELYTEADNYRVRG